MHKVFLASVAHSGTRSVLNAFASCFDVVCNLQGVEKARGDILAWEHMTPETKDVIYEQQHLPVILAVRDPLMTICSHIHRQGDSTTQVVANWLSMVKAPGTHYPIRVDQPDAQQQCEFVRDHLGLYPNPINLRNWGSSGAYPLKSAYQAKDIAYLEKAIPEELAILRHAAGVLCPVLMSWDYTDLIWWS